jgi:aryl-alcohol dehydrogenase-like predicted oxidoreductase
MDITGGPYPLGDLTVTRMGYGAMQLTGPGIFGPPRDRDEAIRVLRTAVELGLRHIDTSDYYGPYVTNELIRAALHPYPEDLVIVTKVGARRTDDAAWVPATTPAELVQAVHDNLGRLGLDAMDVVNLRVMDGGGTPFADQFAALAELRDQGLIKHLGVSNVTAAQLAEVQPIAPVVCVQNFYNLAHRDDEALLASCGEQGIAFTPFFPLGGFSPLQSGTLDAVAARLGHSPLQVALAWLLQHAPNILLIPGTSSVAHLRDNVAAAAIELTPDAIKELDELAA